MELDAGMDAQDQPARDLVDEDMDFNEEQLEGLLQMTKEAEQIKKVMEDPQCQGKRRITSVLTADFLDELFQTEMPPLGAKRLAIAILHASDARCSPHVLEEYADNLLEEGAEEEAGEVLSLLCSWEVALSHEELIDRICSPKFPLPRDEFTFAESRIPMLEANVLEEDDEDIDRIWTGKALAFTLETFGPFKKTIKERQALLEALPRMLVNLPLRGIGLALLTAMTRSFDALVEHDSGLVLILSGLRFALVEVQMNLESATNERDKDMFAFMSGCLFAEAVVTQLDEATKLPIEAVGNILRAVHRIMVVAFDFWLDEENPQIVPTEVSVPLARLISAWTNGDPEMFASEFRAVVPKLLAVAPAEMMPAIVAVHTPDSGPDWLTKESLTSFLEFLLTDGASLPREMGCRIAADIARDPYVDLHAIIPARDKRVYDKRRPADAYGSHPLLCPVLSCPTCCVINAWAHALDEKHRRAENSNLRQAYIAAAYSFRENCGNALELAILA